MYINTRPFLHTPASDTRKYQNELFAVLQDIDMVSEKNDIDYTVEAGTALGAERHKGFIPWDNDADILMPDSQVRDFFIGMAREGLFEKYDIWYFHSTWRWLYKDIYIGRILKDPDNYCETSLDWAISQVTHAVFRIVRKETVTINMGLDKGVDTYQVAHFDTELSTASLQYKFMLPDEKRTWRQRYLLDSDQYKVHPFVDVFPTITMTPDEFVKMKNAQRVSIQYGTVRKMISGAVSNLKKKVKDRILKAQDPSAASSLKSFEDYRVGVDFNFGAGVHKAKTAQQNSEDLVISKAPWNLKKIIPYSYDEIYPTQRVPFEGGTLKAPNKLQQVLRNHYKDYMQMPPEDQRIQHAYHLDPNQFEQSVKING